MKWYKIINNFHLQAWGTKYLVLDTRHTNLRLYTNHIFASLKVDTLSMLFCFILFGYRCNCQFSGISADFFCIFRHEKWQEIIVSTGCSFRPPIYICMICPVIYKIWGPHPLSILIEAGIILNLSQSFVNWPNFRLISNIKCIL